MFASGSPELSFLGAFSWREGHEFEPVEAAENPDLKDLQRNSVLLKAVADDLAGRSWRLEYSHQESATQSELQSLLGTGRFRSTTRLQGDDESSMDLGMFEYDLEVLEPWLDSSVFRAYHLRTDVMQNTLDERKNARTPISVNRLFSYQHNTTGSHHSTGSKNFKLQRSTGQGIDVFTKVPHHFNLITRGG